MNAEDVMKKCPHFDAVSIRDKICVDCWRARALALSNEVRDHTKILLLARQALGTGLRVSTDDVPLEHLLETAHHRLVHDHRHKQELLEANNRYLEDGRAARRELAKAQTTIDALAAQNVLLQQALTTKESELQHGSERVPDAGA